MKNKKIILCKVVDIKPDHIVVEHKSDSYTCPASQISDFKVDLFAYFTVGRLYKFCLVNNKYISYKAIRPKLIKNKRYTMPTMNGVKNLENHLKQIIEKERK